MNGEHSIEIAAPTDKLWVLLTDSEDIRRWNPDVVGDELTIDVPTNPTSGPQLVFILRFGDGTSAELESGQVKVTGLRKIVSGAGKIQVQVNGSLTRALGRFTYFSDYTIGL